ncbi:MAG TPA: 2-phospho-L-lactate guanylyltransferase [Candidatus Fraserbacteria bacterium]|nr:2-phospho-L-lactate guanylyltransferase [Candidatus Fraserbacteria bacterium]
MIAVIPMKPLARAKSRLATELDPLSRMNLAANMLRRVLQATAGASLGEVWVVGGGERVRQPALERGACWQAGQGIGLNAALQWAFDRAWKRGRAALYLPGDLPFITAGDLRALVVASGNFAKIVLVPDRHCRGTNAILAPVGTDFWPALGPDSFQRHLSQAGELGLPVAVCERLGLSCDLDTAEDLQAYQSRDPVLLSRLLTEEGRAIT